MSSDSRSALYSASTTARRCAFQAVAAERADQWAGHDPDPPVTQAIEMRHRFGGRLGVVDVDARQPQPRAEFAAVDDRRAPRGDALHQRRRLFRQPVAEEDQAVGLLPLEHFRVAFLPLLLVLRVADQHVVPLALRRVLDALEDEREEGVRDVGDGDNQLAGAQRAQALGDRVRREAEAFDRLQDAPAGARRDDVRAAQDTRDGRGRDTGALGDFVDGGHVSCSQVRRQLMISKTGETLVRAGRVLRRRGLTVRCPSHQGKQFGEASLIRVIRSIARSAILGCAIRFG